MQVLNRSAAKAMTKVRLVGEGVNEIIGVDEAFSRAEGKSLDLVLVSDQGTPPVVRIQDYMKLEYEKKKAKKANKSTSSVKEMQFKVNISDHDMLTKVNNIRKFLERGDKVKISVRLKGRERETPERAVALISKISGQVDCKVNRLPGPVAMALLEPSKLVVK